MGDLEVQQPQVKLNTQVTDSSTPASTTPATSQGKTTIFAGMTRAEAEQNGLTDEFNKANSDGDDKISDEEFTKYSTPQDNSSVKSTSGKRTAEGGIYTIQKGDTLSKIAQDFGLSLSALYEANVDVIGKSLNATIYPGQKLKISGVATNETNKTDGTSQVNGKVQISADDRAQVIQIMKAFGIDATSDKAKELLQKFNSLPQEKKQSMISELLNQYVDFSKANSDYKGKSLDEIANMIEISNDEWNNADWKKKGTLLAEAMNKKYQADIDETNENSKYNQELQRLKTQGLTDKERELFGSRFDLNNLSENDYKEIAKLCVAQNYAATVLKVAGDNIKDGKEEAFFITAKSYMEALFKDNNTINLVMAMGNAHQLSAEYLTELANKYSEVYKADANTDKSIETLALGTAMENADEEHLNILYQNNADLEDKLNEIAQYVIENTDDETRKAMLTNIVNNSSDIVSGKTTTSTGNNTRTGGRSAEYSVNVTNPYQQIEIDPIKRVSNIRAASQELYTNLNESNSTNPISETKSKYSPYEQVKFDKLQQEIKLKGAQLKNMSLGDALSTLIDYYNTPEAEHFRDRINNFIHQKGTEQLCQAFIDGSEDLQKFLKKENLVNNQLLDGYFRKHPQELNRAPDNIQTALEEYREKQKEPVS